MTEPEEVPAAIVDPAIAPLLAALAAVGGPEDERPEADVLADLDARAEALSSVVDARARAERLDGIRVEIGRLHESAVAGPEALGALRGKIGEARRALGIDGPRLVDPSESVLALIGAPPVGHALTGLDTLDVITEDGFTSGKFHVIAGEPNVGKTSLAVQLARSALGDGWVVGFHVADVDDRTGILLRIAQAHGIDRRRFLAHDPEALAQTATILQSWRPRFAIVDEAADGRTVDDTAAALLALGRANGRRPVLFVDSLQTVQLAWPAGQTPRTDKDRIDQVVKRLVAWTRKGLTVICTCEIPRGFYTGPKKTRGPRVAPPALAAFKGSGNIEYAAWTALVITRIRGEADAVRVEVPKNKQGREDVTFKLVRTASRVGYEDAGELHEHGADDDAPTGPARPRQENLEPYRERVRKALAGRPSGLQGGRDDLTTLAGGKSRLTRAAIADMFTSGELLSERPEGGGPRIRLRRAADGAAPAPVAEPALTAIAGVACGVCGLARGTGADECPPCAACGGCRRAIPSDGGCLC